MSPRSPGRQPGRVGVLVALLLLLGAGSATAQVYDVPAFHPPYGESQFGLYLFFPNDVDDVGVMGTWRDSGDLLDLGFRAGALGFEGETGLLAAVELKDHVVRASEEFPLDVAWVSGVGITGFPGSELEELVRIPLGFSFGRALGDEDVSFVPYIYPRLALDFVGDDTDLGFDLDLGFDASFATEWSLRFAFTLGDHEAVGVGLAFVDL